MSLIKRCTLSLKASIDNLVGQVENHEAIAESAIKELDRRLAKTRAKLAGLERAGNNLEAKKAELEKSINTWKERARKNKESDKDKALECLKRAKITEQELEAIQKQIERNQEVVIRLRSDISQFNQKHSDLKLKIKELSARDCRAQTMKLSSMLTADNTDDLDQLFERWEEKIDEREYLDVQDPEDSFEREFIDEEQRKELEQELNELN